MIVVDTNVLVYYYIKGDFTEIAASVHKKDATWVAPFLWRGEFRNTALLFLRKDLLTLSQVSRITQAAQNRMRDYEFHIATNDVYRLAKASNCSAYDCEFVALAQELQVPLVTVDKKVLREFPETAVTPQQFLEMQN
ncbi:MAG: PIN domain-containing protein [Chloroflexi bacterium]|nr:MAG: PIN domain-containing protein [Chloroflexota bacterium]